MAHTPVQNRNTILTGWIITALVVLVPLALWRGLRDYTLSPKLLILQIALLFLLVFWLTSGRPTLRLPSSIRPALCYLLASALSLFQATDPVAGLLEGTKLLSGFLLFLIVANRLEKAHLSIILTATACTGLMVSLLGMAQYLGWRPFNLPSAGLPSATLGFRNIAAMYLIQNLPFGLALLALSQKQSWFAALAVGAMLVFLAYTRTRGAWLGLTVGLLFISILMFTTRSRAGPSPFKHKAPQIGITLALVLFLAWLPQGVEKLGPQSIDEKKIDVGAALSSIVRQGGDRGRLGMWGHTLDLVRDHPMLGVGLGNWSVHYPRYDGGDSITFKAAPERPHNDPLGILSETGLVGLACYFWLLLTLFRSARQRLSTSDPLIRWTAAACLAGLIAIFVHSFFSFPRERITPTLFFWLSAGLLARFETENQISSPRWLPAGLLLLIALQLGLTYRLIRFETSMYRAVHAEHRNDWEQVAVETQQAIQAGAFHPEAVHLAGYALNALGRFSESRAHYQTALRRRPYDIQMLNGLAIAVQNLGDYRTAEAHYRLALSLVDRLPDVHYNLAGLYLQMGLPDRAASEYETVLVQENPTLDLYYRLGAAYFLARQAPAAARAYQNALQHTPDSAVTHFEHIERLFRTHRQSDLALHAYRTFVTNWKGDPRRAEDARKRILQLKSNRPQ